MVTPDIVQPPTVRLVAPDGRSWLVPAPWEAYIDLGTLGQGDQPVAHFRIDLSETPCPTDGPISGAVLRWTYTDERYDGTPVGDVDAESGTAVIDPNGFVRLHVDPPRPNSEERAG